MVYSLDNNTRQEIEFTESLLAELGYTNNAVDNYYKALIKIMNYKLIGENIVKWEIKEKFRGSSSRLWSA